ncbi:YciI family protein [Microbulbifer thermotolerans]|uniref:YciI family protein n=1 Tax=Microbulbifer thermotolerans TaxID=252514 RepID=UPI00224B4D55|nr:YciI family protein [Microbulbifer thermotolerans]MCX2835898.1 YciI family protein [Microbulbifer thermotolerans]
MKYLCSVYPRVSATGLPPAAGVSLLFGARDLNRALQRLGHLLGEGDSAVLWRLAQAGAGFTNCREESAMKYLCLVYSDEEKLYSLPESPEDAECRAYAESVAESGRMIAAEALEPVSSATTVRMRAGKVMITDGPFAETKEQLAGFYLLDAQNLDEALDIAAGIPAARVGCVEVRPVREL